MKVPQFSFKSEPLWIWLFSLMPALFSLLILLIVLLFRRGIASE
jgi:hypothetical protein